VWTFSAANSKACETVGIVSDQVKVSVCWQVSSQGLGRFKNGMLIFISLLSKDIEVLNVSLMLSTETFLHFFVIYSINDEAYVTVL